jgi:ATP-binding cassette subfamily C protein
MPLTDFLSQLNILDPKKAKITVQKESMLRLDADGKVYDDLSPAKPFPITSPEYVIFRDGNGVDVCVVRNFNELDDESKRSLQSILDKVYFIPKVVKIERIETSGDEFEWDIVTDKGARTFRTRGRMSIIPVGDRVIVTDVNDNVYEIEDVYKLDGKSRRELEGTI